MLSFFVEFSSTSLDFLLFHFLIRRKFALRWRKNITYPLFLIFCIGISILRNIALSTSIHTFLILCLLIIYALIQFSISFANTIFWGITFIFSVFLSDQIAYTIISLYNISYLSSMEITGCIRFQGMLIYHLSLLTMIILLSLKRTSLIEFPIYMIVSSVFLIFLGGILLYLLMDTTVLLAKCFNTNNMIYRLEFANILLLLVFALTIFQLNQLGKIYARHLDLAHKQQTLVIENERLQAYKDTSMLIREWKHDFNSHMQVLQLLSHNNQWTELSEYIETMYQEQHPSNFMLSTGNPILDSVLSAKILTAKQYNIPIEWSVFLPNSIPLSPIELTSIISNLLDNAINATKSIPSDQAPYISFCLKPIGTSLFIIVNNKSTGEYSFTSSGALLSNQISIEHGIGLNRVKEIVEKYEGFMQIKPEEEAFTVKILIPMDISVHN